LRENNGIHRNFRVIIHTSNCRQFLTLGSPTIKNVQEVLVQKELELAKAKKELDALRIVVLLLRDEEDWVRETAVPTLTVTGQSLIEAETVTRPGSVNAGFELDSPPASSSWRVRWREAANRFFPAGPSPDRLKWLSLSPGPDNVPQQ
jgi:hypothetical protein